MKRIATIVVAGLAVLAFTDLPTAKAQAPGQRPGVRRDRPEGRPGARPGDRPGRPDARPGDRPQGRFGAGRPGGPPPFGFNPIIAALDANRDGELSADEIENAAAALKKLDKNGDGKITREELRPQFGRPPQGRPEGAGGGRFTPEAFVERVMQNDKNKDGKLTKDEIPERAARFLERFDTNKDGVIEKSEIEEAAKRFSAGRGGAGRPQRPDAGRPGSGRPKRPEGAARPKRPDA